MLLPATNKAKERGRAIECVNKLHQMGLAAVMYAHDYDDFLPRLSQGTIQQGDVVLWTDLLTPYLSGLSAEELWLCPSGNRFPDPNGCGKPMVLHYGMNNYDYDGAGTEYLPGLGGRPPCPGGVQLHIVAEPDTLIYLADSDPESSPEDIGGQQSGTTDWPLTSLAENRHTHGYNALFLGGSVQWRPNAPNHREWAVRKK